MTSRLLIALAVLLVLPVSAMAKETALGSFGVWKAYAEAQGGQTVCYMVTGKTVASTGPAKRSPPYVMITHRPIEGSTDVVSYGAGALLNTRRGVQAMIGKARFDLFAARDTAWARDALTDHRLAAALRNAPRVQFKATSAHAKPIHDVFDLTGAPAAYRAISKACGLPEDKKRLQPIQTKKARKAVAKKTVTHKSAVKKGVATHGSAKTP